MSTFETLKGMIVKQMKVNPDTVTESSRLVEDLKADSANVMVMIMDVETRSASPSRMTRL